MSTHALLLVATALADALDDFAALDPPPNLAAATDHLVTSTRDDLLQSCAAVLTSRALLVAYREARA